MLLPPARVRLTGVSGTFLRRASLCLLLFLSTPVLFAHVTRTTFVGTRALLDAELKREEDSPRVDLSEDHAFADRYSAYDYDERGRLQRGTILALGTPDSPAGVMPAHEETLSPADFRAGRTMAPRLDEGQRSALGPLAARVEPSSWTATEQPAHEIELRTRTLGSTTVGTDNYAFEGGRQTTDGVWDKSYDEEGRLVTMTSLTAGRRIDLVYDPMSRVVGRTASRLTDVGTWILEDRTSVLARDGLPAASTLVWDPMADRLVAIYEAGKSTIVSGHEKLTP